MGYYTRCSFRTFRRFYLFRPEPGEGKLSGAVPNRGVGGITACAHLVPLVLIMRRYILLVTACICFALHSAAATTNLLSIYLVVAERDFPQWMSGTMPAPDSLRLVSPPVLADADFIRFDTTNQTFSITPDAAKRLEAKIMNGPPTLLRDGVYELIPFTTPFVLKASGKPIYVGAFYATYSSSQFAGPVILSDRLTISANLTNNVSFRIELGYGGMLPGMADPRRDSRVVSAVQKLFSHENK